MDELTIRRLIDDVQSGSVTPDDAVRQLRRLPFADLGFARVDHHRSLRQGMVEAVYGPGKTPEQCASIVAELLAEPDLGAVLLTRAEDDQIKASLAHNADGTVHGRMVVWRPSPERPGNVLVLTAGTADIPVAEEAMTTLTALGFRPKMLVDCGVAGIHRLLASSAELQDADAIVVVAGMEGALASLVGGVAACPVIAVPTSVGYGSSFEGVTALLAMHASCAAGVTVVGIDNGFGAASAVARMFR